VAVKVFRPSERIAPGNLARFRLEGITACRVQHPNAVYVFDAGVAAAGIPYLVMELLEGETLAELLARERRLPLAFGMKLLADVADVLATAHKTGIVHRDIKPENVYLHRTGQGQVVKVLDFGIAKLAEESGRAELSRLTGTGQMLGTPTYMSPERLRGEAYDGRADVYSLGVMMHELLGGCPPFASATGNPWEVVKAHLEEPPPPLDHLVPEAPAALVALASACLEKSIARRPAAEAVAFTLRQLRESGELEEPARRTRR
jgi:serine/threonine protein kinase